MPTVLLVRAGATEYDLQGRIAGTLSIPLCPDGIRQAEQAAESLRGAAPAALFSSADLASTESAAVIGRALGLKPRTLDKLHNLDHGLWQGLLVDEVRTKHPKVYRQWQEQPETVCPPQGETVLGAKARVAETLRKLIRRQKDWPIALVAPEPLVSLVRHVLRRDDLHDLWKTAESCGHVESVEAPDDLAIDPS